jgi:hypothetical protein
VWVVSDELSALAQMDAVTAVDAGALRTSGTRIGFADPAWGEGAGTDGCAPGRYPLVLGFAPTDDPRQGLVAAYAVVVLGPGQPVRTGAGERLLADSGLVCVDGAAHVDGPVNGFRAWELLALARPEIDRRGLSTDPQRVAGRLKRYEVDLSRYPVTDPGAFADGWHALDDELVGFLTYSEVGHVDVCLDERGEPCRLLAAFVDEDGYR